MNAVTGLMDIVEGVQNIRWQFEGRRLVDTPQWCDLYCAWCAEKRKQENKLEWAIAHINESVKEAQERESA